MRRRLLINSQALTRAGSLLLLAVMILNCAGCAFFATAYQNARGTSVSAQYTGLDNHSVAILVYADDSITFMYPQAREEISGFIADQFQKNMPSVRLLDYQQVIAYQDQTPGWESLPIKSVGDHFSVDRVLYLELVNYTTHAAGATDLLQGHIEANVYIYDTKLPGDGLVYQTHVDVYSPANGPAPPFDSDENSVRMAALGEFSRDVVRNFYNWHNYAPDQDNTGNTDNTGSDESENLINQQ
ncbi:MAG TPA: hypothetical protein VMG59_03825 [Phycisphaerae bacterium]|nr:hypothetical protein [Phycisphaerae bacterium]